MSYLVADGAELVVMGEAVQTGSVNGDIVHQLVVTAAHVEFSVGLQLRGHEGLVA